MANRLNDNPGIPNRHFLAVRLMNAVVEQCEETAQRVRGHAIIEDGIGTPMGMTYAAYENGNYMAWFTDEGRYHLYALVNENLRHVFSVEANEQNTAALQVKLDELKSELEP